MKKVYSLTKQIVQVALNAGLNRKRDAHQLQNGELLTADNVVYSAVDGQVTKRFGYKPITPQGAPFQGGPFKALGCRDNIEPIVLGQNTFNRYNIDQNLSTSLPMPTQGRLDVAPVIGSTGQTTFPWPPSHAHVAIDDNGKYACVVWEEPNPVGALLFYGIQDQKTGAWIISPKSMPVFLTTITNYVFTAYAQPQVNYYNGYFYISYLWNGNTGSSYRTFCVVNTIALNNLAAGFTAISSPRDLSALLAVVQPNSNGNQLVQGTSVSYDLHVAKGRFSAIFFPDSSSSRVTTLYANTGIVSGRTLVLSAIPELYLPPNSDVGSNLYLSLRVATKCDGPASNPIAFSTEVAAWVSDSSGDTTRYAFQETFANVYYRNSPVDILFNGSKVYFTGYASNKLNVGSIILYMADLAFQTVTQVVCTTPIGSYLIELLSRLFVLPSGRICFWCGAGSNSSDNVYNAAYLLEVDPTQAVANARTIARTQYLSNYKLNYFDKTTPCEVFQVKGTQQFVSFLSAGVEKAAVAGGSTWRAYGVLNRAAFDYAPTRQVQVLPMAPGGNIIAGAYPLYYDGAELVEAGFSAAPDYTAGQPNIAGYGASAGQPTVDTSGGSLAAATYSYICCFVRRDAYGNVYRSAGSSVITVNATGSNNTISFRPLFYSGGGNVRVEYYRNTPTLAGQGTYYFVGSAPVLTHKNQDFTYFRDALADSGITGGRAFNQSETPNDPAPASYHMAASDTRMFCIPADNRNQVWCSKLFTPGRTVEWSSSQYVTEGQNAGLFTGLAVLDNNVIVFKDDSICYFYGQGPDNSGANGGFSALQKLATDVGCIDAASIKVTPDGVVFRSRRGIELLSRSLQVKYIGNNVEPLVQTLGQFSSVVLMPNYTELRFIPAGVGEPVLCFDYGSQRWSTFGEGATGASCWASVQAASIQGVYWWISQDGSMVNVETPGAYLDNTVPVTMTLETSEVPVSGAGAQGWGRLYRMAVMGDFYTDHKLEVSFQYDHQKEYTDVVIFDTQNGLVAGDAVFQFRCSRVPRQRMQTVRLRFRDTEVSGQSCAISNLALEVGDKGGLARLPGAKTI